jgi:hypothetical protein
MVLELCENGVRIFHLVRMKLMKQSMMDLLKRRWIHAPNQYHPSRLEAGQSIL